MPGKKHVQRKPAKTPSGWPRRWLWALAVALACGAVVPFARSWLASPEIRLLVPEHGASWIHENRPFDLRAFGPTAEVVFFRKQVKVPPGIESAVLTIHAFRGCIVYWDKQQRFVADRQGDWKSPRVVTLDGLTAGEHTLEVFVANSFGPAALLAYCDALDVRTGPGWEESVSGGAWLPALSVDDVQPPVSKQTLDSPATALKKNLWWLVRLCTKMAPCTRIVAAAQKFPAASVVTTSDRARSGNDRILPLFAAEQPSDKPVNLCGRIANAHVLLTAVVLLPHVHRVPKRGRAARHQPRAVVQARLVIVALKMLFPMTI